MQDLEAHLLGQLLELQQEFPRSICNSLMDLDVAELGVSVTSVSKTGNQHTFQNRVYAFILLINLIQALGLDSEFRQLGEHV